jgi:hypothetical protein
MNVQQDSWKSLDTLLPCSSCVAGKMRKANSPSTQTYSDIRALTTDLLAQQNPARHFGFAVSRTPATTAQINQRNKIISVDWAMVNKQNKPGASPACPLGPCRVPANKRSGRRDIIRVIHNNGVFPIPYTITARQNFSTAHLTLSAKPTASHKHNLPPTHRTRTLPNTTWNS